jgi:hypothetical protein
VKRGNNRKREIIEKGKKGRIIEKWKKGKKSNN